MKKVKEELHTIYFDSIRDNLPEVVLDVVSTTEKFNSSHTNLTWKSEERDRHYDDDGSAATFDYVLYGERPESKDEKATREAKEEKQRVRTEALVQKRRELMKKSKERKEQKEYETFLKLQQKFNKEKA